MTCIKFGMTDSFFLGKINPQRLKNQRLEKKSFTKETNPSKTNKTNQVSDLQQLIALPKAIFDSHSLPYEGHK